LRAVARGAPPGAGLSLRSPPRFPRPCQERGRLPGGLPSHWREGGRGWCLLRLVTATLLWHRGLSPRRSARSRRRRVMRRPWPQDLCFPRRCSVLLLLSRSQHNLCSSSKHIIRGWLPKLSSSLTGLFISRFSIMHSSLRSSTLRRLSPRLSPEPLRRERRLGPRGTRRKRWLRLELRARPSLEGQRSLS
jgi:hypothetical protein